MSKPIPYRVDYAKYSTLQNILKNKKYPFNDVSTGIIIENLLETLALLESNNKPEKEQLFKISESKFLINKEFPITLESKKTISICKKLINKNHKLDINKNITYDYIINLAIQNYICKNKEYAHDEEYFNHICCIIDIQNNNQ